LRPLGPLYKVKPLLDEESTRPLLARVVNFQKVKQSIIETIFREALTLKALECKYLLPIEGIIFNKKSKIMHIFYPQKISLFEYIHLSGTHLSPEDKYTIAKNIAYALSLLHSCHNPPAHSHLTSKNIMLNPSDHHVYITDYSLRSLKKFAKVHNKYNNLSAWSSPEMWTDNLN